MSRKEKIETLDMFSGDHVIANAKRETMNAAKESGCSCPVCGQFVKVYKRTINSTMARQLITAFHKHGAGTWFHTRDVVLIDSSGAGDFSKLEYWGLIERQAHVQGDDSKRSSGQWRITGKGGRWALGKEMIPMYALVYNGKLLELDGAQIEVRHALGKKFDYNEIMGWTGAARAAV